MDHAERLLTNMRKLILLSLLFVIVLPAFAADNEAKVKAAVEDRYKEWVAAANKKDLAMMTNLYDENAVLMPKSEEPVIGKPRLANTTRSCSPIRTLCRSR